MSRRRSRGKPRPRPKTSKAPDEGLLAECRIESLAAGGDGVGRLPDGRTVFVPFTAPGDRIELRVDESRSRYARGSVSRLIEESPDRATPACPAFGSCGGCQWQHIAYPEQLRAKADILRNAFERVGGIRCPDPISWTASPLAYAYRHRARVHHDRGRIGYLRRRSHAICPVRACPVLEPQLEAALVRLADRAEEARQSGREYPQGEWELALFGAGDPRVSPAGDSGGPALQLEVLGRSLRISPGVFAQSNGLLLDDLARAVTRAATEDPARGDGLLLELFAGAGTLTLDLAPHFLRTVAVESHPAAVSDLRFNLDRHELRRVEVVEAEAEDYVDEIVGGGPSPDVVVLDPPRRGLAPGAAQLLAGLAASRIVYLSCDPATLARDSGEIVANGYSLVRIEGFDLFPQTHHVEALATFVREGPER